MAYPNGVENSVYSRSASTFDGWRWQSLWRRITRLDWRGHEPPPPAECEAEDFSGIHQRAEALPGGAARAIDVPKLTRWLYQLSPEACLLREQIKTVLAREEFDSHEGLTLEQQAQRSYARFQLVRQLLDLRVSDVRDRPARLVAALELIGAVDATLFTVMNIHYCLCAGTLLRHGRGSPEIAAYLRELDTGDAIGTFLATELGYGNNLVSLETRADYDPERGDLVLSTPSPEARKFMPNTALTSVPKIGVVMARLHVRGADCGIFPFVVRLCTRAGISPGVSIAPLGDKPAFSLDNAVTTFSGVRVPKGCLLLGEHCELDDDGTFSTDIPRRRARFLRAIEQVQLGRLCLSGVGATATGASAFIAIKYGEQRRTFAPRRADVCVLDYRNYQRDAFSTLAYAYASRCLLGFAIRTIQTTDDSEHDYIFRVTGATKAHVTYATERFVRLCRERCGAAGMFEENRLSAYAAQAQGLVTAEGDNQILLIKIARQMLLRQGYVRLSEERARLSLSLTEPPRLIGLLRERERRLLNRLRRAMVSTVLPHHELFTVWNENINLALETSLAHASRMAVEKFADRAAELDGGHPVRDLFRLFALQEMAPHLGFYLAEELLTREEVESHSAMLDRLCQGLRPYALSLAEACDVPNDLLRAPIASDDYVSRYDARAREAESAADSGRWLERTAS